MRKSSIVLIGFMGSGKTTIAKELTKIIPDYNLVDTDYLIEKNSGKSIKQIFEEDGEDHFRNLETALLEKQFEQSNLIISTGGGIILREQNRPLLKQAGVVFWLSASPQTIYQRIKHETTRPLIQTGKSQEAVIEQIETILDNRFEIYKECADCIINTESFATISEIANCIKSEYENLIKCLK